MPDQTGEIEFWFDFGSPYAYFASHTIGTIAATRRLLWRPFVLGGAFKATGMSSLSRTPMRGAMPDMIGSESREKLNVKFAIPPNHPVNALPAARAFCALDEQSSELASAFVRRAFDGYFADGLDIGQAEVVAQIAGSIGADSAVVLEAMLP